jgi:hypothetical protein
MSGEGNTIQQQQENEEIRETLKLILTKREINIESFICNIASMLTDANKNNMVTSAEENNQALLNMAEEKMAEVGILINHKFSSILKEYLILLQEKKMASMFSSINLPIQDMRNTSINYRDCFDAWTNSPFVSYKTTNVLQLGKLTAKDALLLHVFSFLTCLRVKGDNLFAISFSGASTVGKSTLWENPMYENAHSFVNDSGVGRWSVKKKNLLFYHDINVNILVKGKDSEKFKTISRTEVTVCKVFGKTEVLPPLFVCITSNMRIHDHQFIQVATKQQPFGKYINFKGQMQLPTTNSESSEVILAVQNRILECFVYKRPELDVSKLPHTGTFTRMNGILGMYSAIITILEGYTFESFFTCALLSYVLTGLVDNFVHYNQFMIDGECTKKRIINVIYSMYSHDPDLAREYLSRLGFVKLEQSE